MLQKIFKLPKNLISKIAAGEVVERPASVVKELLENAIDAGATELTIIIEQGGKKTITVVDNGEGMTEIDALNCFNLHTTSKISSEKDLDNILTFGFRGEALASICAISECTIHTFNQESTPIKLIVGNSELISKQNIPRVQGTTVTIKDIFRHLPARRKFLKTDSTEFKHIAFEISKIAIAKPFIKIEFIHNNKTIFSLPNSQSAKERILQFFKDIKPDLLIDLHIKTPEVSLDGYIIHPQALSTDNSRQYLFLNGRFVIDRTLIRAIKDGYSSTIPKDYQPGYILNLTLDPKKLDVNIHPRKLEVKIDNIQTVYGTIKNSIQTKLNSTLKDQLQEKFDTFTGSRESRDNLTFNQNKRELIQNHIKDSLHSPDYNYASKSKIFNNRPSRPDINNAIQFSQALISDQASPITQEIEEFKFIQIFDTYLIIEKLDKLVIIDQHAAHERVNYEKYLSQLKQNKKIDSQPLLLPYELEVDEDIFETFNNNSKTIQTKTGIDFKAKANNTLLITSQPSGIQPIRYKDLINEIYSSLQETDALDEDASNHRYAALLACHNSIRAGKKMYPEEVKQLVNQLYNCANPYSCPHGRPIIWELTKSEIEKNFGRKK